MYPSDSNASTPKLNTTNVLAIRTSGSQARLRAGERASLAASLNADPKFKKYTAQVDKCLQTFDNVQEWADFIAFLTKLLKTFQSYMQFKEIPRKLIVAKRLSQCLNPALPTGVHQRALDVYSHILAVLGTEGLKRDPHLWSAGLFPFFEYAATSVKPTVLNLCDTYYLPLQDSLRPIMKAFILALLPGLEEEAGEFFEKVLSLLDRLSGSVSFAFFLQNIWLIMIVTPAARQVSLNFLVRRLPKLNGEEDIAPIIGRDTGLMIRAFAAALEDDNILVRRAMLDLLEQAFTADSPALKRATVEDQRILMRVASSVVLRRDLSLNRRLFGWLLGSGPEDGQPVYFRKHALSLLKDTLQEDMFASVPESRPFKIFISLLDKWEIGGPLVDELLFDAFKAIKRGILQHDESSDLLITANALYDAVEPFTIWRQFFTAVRLEVLSGESLKGFEAMSMVNFVLIRLRAQEEEVQNVHLPILFAALTELTQELVECKRVGMTCLYEILQLLIEVERNIPTSVWQRSIFHDVEKPDYASPFGPYAQACKFYSVELDSEKHINSGHQRRSLIPLVTAVEDLLSLSTSLSRIWMDSTDHPDCAIESLLMTMTLLINLVNRESTIVIAWQPSQWLDAILDTLQSRSSFILADKVITTVLALGRASLQPPLIYDERTFMFKVVCTLTHFLGATYAPYHLRAVHLIWMLEQGSSHHHVESLIAQSLSSPESRNVYDAYEAFGVLWRLTDDAQLPGFCFKIPMLMVLDTLKHDDPGLKRIGETWMRCSLKSYLRVLEPLLYDLLDTSILRDSCSLTYGEHEVSFFVYKRRFDENRINYLLETLISFVKFGGQGFSRVARSSHYQKSSYPGFVERVETHHLVPPDASYMDVLLKTLLLYLQSEPQSSLMPFMRHRVGKIQANSIDLLQTIIARGDLDGGTLQMVEATVMGKLYVAVHEGKIDIQNTLLHLLHTTFSSISASMAPPRLKPNTGRASDHHDIGAEKEDFMDDKRRISHFIHINPLLVPTLVNGISKAAGQPGLQHWVDFILMTVPQYPRLLSYTVPTLCDCICQRLKYCLEDVNHVLLQDPPSTKNLTSNITDSEFIMLLNALERLVLLGLSRDHDPIVNVDREEEIFSGRPVQDVTSGGGLLGMVSNVFGSESHTTLPEEALSTRSLGYRILHESIRTLHALWVLTGKTYLASNRPELESLLLILSKTRTRGRKVMERLFRVQMSEVMESIVECWQRAVMEGSDPIAAFEIVDALTSSAQTVVHMLCESISYRTALSDKFKKLAMNPNLSDSVLYNFLEEYLCRLEGPLAVQVWGRCMTLAKDIVGNITAYRMQLFPTLRCMTVLADKITQMTAVEDRRTRKELQDIYTKLVDNAILIAGRSSDLGTWIRRTTKETATPVNGRFSPIPPVDEDKPLPPSLDSFALSVGTDLPEQVNVYLALKVLPNLRRFLFDNDKVASVCSNVAYYIITPALKARTSKILDLDDHVLDTLRELSRIPAGTKAWKPLVLDMFNDSQFFNSTPDISEKMRPIIRALLDSDRQALPEIIGKITSTGSSIIFANREYETLLRSLNLRRLSYAIFTGEKNQFLTHLPLIQEKLVDVLRNINPALVESEVYLCLRVLLCRLSPHNLSSFWPVILTELLRLYDEIISEPPADGSDSLYVVLSASKLIDLTLALQTEEFQIHQWMFITDTVDAVYRPDDWFPEGLMDQLAEIISDLPASKEFSPVAINMMPHNKLDSAISHHTSPSTPMRRPFLTHVRQIGSIRDLLPFFSHLSIASYEGVYHCGGNIDWQAIEKSLLEDMFEGR